MLAALWTGGFFTLHGGYDTGPGHEWGTYGDWSFDLLGFFDGGAMVQPAARPAGYRSLGSRQQLSWSRRGAALGGRSPGLGWGGRHALPCRLWPLAAALLALLAFAVTHRVTIAGHTWMLFDPPARVLAALEILRNSDRMVWPLAYALMVGAIATLDRVWGGRRTGWLLLGMLGLQAVDVGPQLVKIHGLVAAAPAAVPQRLSDPFWTAAARRYARVRAVPGENLGEGWADIARFAALAGLPTDAIYMARVELRSGGCAAGEDGSDPDLGHLRAGHALRAAGRGEPCDGACVACRGTRSHPAGRRLLGAGTLVVRARRGCRLRRSAGPGLMLAFPPPAGCDLPLRP